MQKGYSEENKQELEDRLLKAKVQVMTTSPYFSVIMHSMKHHFQDIPEAAMTDGSQVIYDGHTIAGMPDSQLAFTVFHESAHPALNHMTRKRDRKHRIYNIAGDHVINLMAKQAGYDVPSWTYCDSRFKGMSTDQVYDILIQEGFKPPESFMPDIISVEAGSEEAEKIENTIMKATLDAELSGNYGNVPGEIKRFVDKLINPVIPWSAYLQQFAEKRIRTGSRNWSRARRRLMPKIFLPRSGERVVGRAVFGVDTSGSISQGELVEYFSECQYIRDLYEIQDTVICGCDTRLHDIVTLDSFDNMVDVKFKGGGGGTDMDPLIKYANKHEVDFMVIFTDGYFGNLTVPPEVPILWVITSDKQDFQSDIGEIIYYADH